MTYTPLALDSFISSVNASAYAFGSYIKSYQERFGSLPDEEELNGRFSSEYALAIQKKYTSYTPIGSIISETDSNPVKHAIETIVQLWAEFEEDRVWHLIYPNQYSERRLGWDFAWIIKLPNGSKCLTFVQAKNVTYAENDSRPMISFDHRNFQSNAFSLWLKYMVTISKSNIQVNGLYLLYGAPESPISWATWNEVSAIQRTHKKTNLVAQAVIRLVERRKGAQLTTGILSDFVAASDIVAAGEKKSAEDIM